MDYRTAGALLNSALYLFSIVWFGFMSGHPTASLIAISTMGVLYVAYCVAMVPLVTPANLLVALSIGMGLVAGLMLLV